MAVPPPNPHTHAALAPAAQRPLPRPLQAARRLLPWVALAMVPLCILALVFALRDLRDYPAMDLHLKVVGARRMMAGFNPYNPYADPEHRDYFRSDKNLTSSPALLALFAPLSPLPYLAQRAIYFWLDWVLAAATFALIAIHFAGSRTERLLCWVVYAAWVFLSFSFRMHLVFGQYYVLQLFLCTVTAVSLRRRRYGWLAAIAPALLILLRPTFGLILIVPFILMGARKWTLRVVAMTVAMFLGTLALGPVSNWHAYFQMIKTRQAENILIRKCQVCRIPGPTKPSTDHIIEGLDFSKRPPGNTTDGTFVRFLTSVIAQAGSRFGSACRLFSIPWITRLNSAGSMLVLLLGAALAWVARGRVVSKPILIALTFLWPLTFELFGPERYMYVAVVDALPLLLLLLDPAVLGRILHKRSALWAWAAILFLAIVPPIVTEFIPVDPIQPFASILVLFAMPLSLAAFCAWAVLSSPRRVAQSTPSGSLPSTS